MDRLDQFLKSLLYTGRIVLRSRPELPADSSPALGVLQGAYEIYRLEVAGPPIPFDPEVALEASERVFLACWALVNRNEGYEALERGLRMTRIPRTASQHLSADLVFHFLPQIYRRARAIDRNDPLPALIADLLCRWPLSGVLCDLDVGPASPLNLGGHDGLMLLYAERWERHEHPMWRPSEPTSDYVELVLNERGADDRPPRPAG